MMVIPKYNKSLISLIAIAVFLLFAIFISVEIKNSDEGIAELVQGVINKLEIMRSNILGNSLLEIDSIISGGEFVYDSPKLIGYYHSYNCGGCVNKLMQFISVIDTEIPIFIISNSSENISPIRNHNLYLPYFVDKDGAFQEWTLLSYTPMLLYLDEDEVIREVYFPTTPSYQLSRSRFFEYLKSARS